MDNADEPRAPGQEEPGCMAGVLFPGIAAAAWSIAHIVTATTSLQWGCLTAVIVFGIWILAMPCTCQQGGLLSSMIAMGFMITALVYVVITAGAWLISSGDYPAHACHANCRSKARYVSRLSDRSRTANTTLRNRPLKRSLSTKY